HHVLGCVTPLPRVELQCRRVLIDQAPEHIRVHACIIPAVRPTLIPPTMMTTVGESHPKKESGPGRMSPDAGRGVRIVGRIRLRGLRCDKRLGSATAEPRGKTRSGRLNDVEGLQG